MASGTVPSVGKDGQGHRLTSNLRLSCTSVNVAFGVVLAYGSDGFTRAHTLHVMMKRGQEITNVKSRNFCWH